MYNPINNSFAGTITSAATLDISLHTVLGTSWKILLPYTIFGALLMVYSQARLIRGQHALSNKNSKNLYK